MPEFSLKSTFASLPRAERAKSVRLGGDPKKKNFLYCNGNSVYIRNLEKPEEVDIYTQHSRPVTIARYSPSGFYIASGDVSGKVRIWDTTQAEHICKAEYPVLGGEISDLDWCPESQRLVVCGNGREKFASVIKMDTGTTLGTVAGHGKSINTCSFRPKRPYLIVTASEDFSMVFHEGPPFKFKKTHHQHTNFVNAARFSGNGDVVFSCGSDRKLIRYDVNAMNAAAESQAQMKGDENVGVTEINAHEGGVYELSYSPDDVYVATASGDKTVRVFEVATGELKKTFVLGDKSANWTSMQLGVLWQGDHIITVNARGHISYLSMDQDKPTRVIKGHMKPVTALAVDPETRTIFSGGQEGIFYWNADTGVNDEFMGQGHTNEVTDMVIDGDTLISVGFDDTVRFSSISGHEFSRAQVKLDSQPKGVSALRGFAVVASVGHLTVLEGTNKLSCLKLPSDTEALSVCIHHGGSTVAVGFKDSKVRIYSLQSGALNELKVVEVAGEVAVVTYSPDGAYLAVAADRRVSVLSASDYKELSKADAHTARVRCLAWSPDSSRFASGGLDSNILLWDDVNDSYKKRPVIKGHMMSHANKIAWLDTHTVVTGGQDSNIKQFSVSD